MGRKPIYGNENNDDIKSLYEDGFSLNAIARRFGMHPQVVKRKLASMGVASRGKSAAMRLYHKNKDRAIPSEPTVTEEPIESTVVDTEERAQDEGVEANAETAS